MGAFRWDVLSGPREAVNLGFHISVCSWHTTAPPARPTLASLHPLLCWSWVLQPCGCSLLLLENYIGEHSLKEPNLLWQSTLSCWPGALTELGWGVLPGRWKAISCWGENEVSKEKLLAHQYRLPVTQQMQSYW